MKRLARRLLKWTLILGLVGTVLGIAAIAIAYWLVEPRLPTPAEIEAFLADQAPDKRTKKIDELLDRPAYYAWITTLLCDQTGNNSRLLNGFMQGNGYNNQISEQWYAWIHRRMKENMPYDKLIAGMVLAAGLGYLPLFIFAATSYLLALGWIQLMLPKIRLVDAQDRGEVLAH